MKRGNKTYSIFQFKCPKCHEGDLFATGTWTFQKPFDMHKRCPHCNENYMPEPGFYYGAMFLSYIFSAVFSLAFVFFFHWVLGWSTGASFAFLVFVLGIFFVWFFRFSRALWINIMVHYDPAKGLK